VSEGKYKKVSGKYAYELETKVPAVQTVEGAPLGSVSKIKIKAGAAYKKNGQVVSYGTVPKKGECPRKGFPIKAEVFCGGKYGNPDSTNPILGDREFGIEVKEKTVEITAPCPKH
jgi:hypothetical protein